MRKTFCVLMIMRDACNAGKTVEKKKKEIHAAVKQMCTSMVVGAYMSICRRSFSPPTSQPISLCVSVRRTTT
jgi:hypothetical protein